MNLFGLYLFAVLTTVVLFVGWEIRRHSIHQRLRQQRDVESTVTFVNEELSPEHSRGKAVTSAFPGFILLHNARKVSGFSSWVGWIRIRLFPFKWKLAITKASRCAYFILAARQFNSTQAQMA